jgi:hypothetical protein
MAAEPVFVEARETPLPAADVDDVDAGFDSPFDDEYDVPAFLRKKKAAAGPQEG